MNRPCFTSVFSAVAAVALLGSSAHAITLVQTGSPLFAGAGAPTSNSYVMQPFTLKQDVSNFSLDLGYGGTVGFSFTTNVFLSNQVGPGTTASNILASTSLEPIGGNANTTFVNILNLGNLTAGDYHLVFVPPSGSGVSLGNGAQVDNEFGTIGPRHVAQAFGQGTINRTTPVASTFSSTGISDAVRIRLNGDVATTTPPGLPGGDGTFFDFEDDFVGNGVTINGLAAEHGIDSQVLGNGNTETKISELSRTFTFNTDTGSTDPVEVFIHAVLEGRLLADNFSEASAEGLLELKDINDSLLDRDTTKVMINALGGELIDADVYEVLTISAFLTPGMDYTLFSSLTLETEAGLFGAARAFFSDTFEYVISPVQDNPFFDPQQMTTQTTSPKAPLDPTAVPEPVTLGGIALLAAGVMATRRRRCD